MHEGWRDVPGWEGRYEVSDLGRVRSLWWTGRRGSKARKRPLLMSPMRVGKGYLAVTLCDKPNGRRERHHVHRLVLLAFVGPCPVDHETLHANDVKDDNRLSNLRWGTLSENKDDAFTNGRMACGDRSHFASITALQRAQVRSLSGSMSNRRIGERVGIGAGSVSRIINGKDRRR